MQGGYEKTFRAKNTVIVCEGQVFDMRVFPVDQYNIQRKLVCDVTGYY